VEIWFWVLGIVAVFSVVAVVIDRRRGSTGASRSDDVPGAPPSTHWAATLPGIVTDAVDGHRPHR
jgi:hypothetical protein